MSDDRLGQVGTGLDMFGRSHQTQPDCKFRMRAGTGWDRLGQVGTGWDGSKGGRAPVHTRWCLDLLETQTPFPFCLYSNEEVCSPGLSQRLRTDASPSAFPQCCTCVCSNAATQIWGVHIFVSIKPPHESASVLLAVHALSPLLGCEALVHAVTFGGSFPSSLSAVKRRPLTQPA